MPCIFCQILAKEIPAQIIYEDQECIAFRDIHPQAPVHILVVPKRHIASLNQVTDHDAETLGHLIVCANELAQRENVAISGYRLVINCNQHGGQTVFHLHVHLLGGRWLGWPPG